MLAPKDITINGRKYTVNPFTPMEAFEFYHSRLAAFRNGESLLPFAMKAVGKCLTEMLEELSDATKFRAHFSSHPEDLLELASRATEELIGPFEMSGKGTKKTAAT